MTIISKTFPAAALIDGQWVTSAKTFPVTDPATGAEVAAVPDLGAEDAARAIDAAARALPAWSAKTAKERAAILKRWFDLVTAETESLAQLMTTEQGKPLAESRAEVAYGASFIEWFAEEGKRAYGRTIPTTVGSKRYLTIKQPIGVVAAIAPWNFPIAMITRKVAPGARVGMHHRGQARRGDAALCAGDRQARARCRSAARRAQHRHHRRCAGSRQGLL